jgi:hypothetical protein
MKKLLYISINNGSDTRINKEIKSLHSYFDIYYIGIGTQLDKAFAKDYCKSFNVIEGHHSNKIDLIKYFFLFIKIFFSRRYHTIHVINEQNYLIFFPFLFFHNHVILDIFDSMFLKKKESSFKNTLRNIIYAQVKHIIVTDNNRKGLMPKSFKQKIKIIGNYPYKYEKPLPTKVNSILTIFYYGSLNLQRGTKMLHDLLDANSEVRVIMAGWIADEGTRNFSVHTQVDFIGIVNQKEALDVASKCDYLMCTYEPCNSNNINASPNKIYDAIQVETPIIINDELNVASFVKKSKIGIIIPSYFHINSRNFYQQLMTKKNTFIFPPELKNKYTWENVEKTLVQLHKI